ncbi:MAG: hypothetical protein KDB01_17950 [Planctomycetaceae bacterium]|nr:hypothetical protein [Planctomycetaceae bacterium]
MSAVPGSKVFSDARVFTQRQVLLLPVQLVKALIVVPLLSPNQLFLVRLAQTWFSYSQRAAFGTFSVLSLEYPAAERAGDEQACRELTSVAFLFCLLGSLAGILTAAYLSFQNFGLEYLIPLAMWGSVVVPATFFRTYLFARGQFTRIAYLDVSSAVVGTVAALVGYFIFGFSGYLLGTGLALALAIAFGLALLDLRWSDLSLDAVRRIAGRGSRMWVSGFLADITKSFDISYIALFLAADPASRGNYAICFLLIGVISQFVRSADEVFKRRFMKSAFIEESGMVDYVHMLNNTYFLLTCWILGTVALFIGFYVTVWFVPKYRGASDILAFLLLAEFLIEMRQYPAIVYNLRRTYIYDQMGWILGLIFGAGSCALLMVTFPDELRFVGISKFLMTIVLFAFGWACLVWREKLAVGELWRLGGMCIVFAIWVIICGETLFSVTANACSLILGAGVMLWLVYKVNPTSVQNLLKVVGRYT